MDGGAQGALADRLEKPNTFIKSPDGPIVEKPFISFIPSLCPPELLSLRSQLYLTPWTCQ
jgi:hypothetical protein